LMMFYFTLVSGYSGTALFEDNLRITFNGLCTIPILAVGLFDCDVFSSQARQQPALYEIGRLGLDLGPVTMGQTMLSAWMHSLILMYISTSAYHCFDMHGEGDYWTFCCFTYSLLVVAVNFRVAYLTTTWNIWSVVFQVAAFAMYAFFLFVYNIASTSMKPGMHDVSKRMVMAPIFWSCVIIVPLFQLSADILVGQCWKFVTRWCFSLEREKIMQSIDKANTTDFPQADGKSLGLRDAFLKQATQGFQVTSNVKAKSTRLMVASGVILMAIGYVGETNSLVKIFGVEYHSSGEDARGLSHHISKQLGTNSLFNANITDCLVSHGTTKECQIQAPADMEGPLLVYYSLGSFYQNSIDFVKTTDYTKNSLASNIAKRTFFNDTFNTEGLDETSISWPTDLSFVDTLPQGADALYGRDAMEHFAVWMRPAALPQVNKRYGWLHKNLTQGETLTFNITSNFPSPGSYKQLLITNYDQYHGAGSQYTQLLTLGSILAFLVAALTVVLPDGSAAKAREKSLAPGYVPLLRSGPEHFSVQV